MTDLNFEATRPPNKEDWNKASGGRNLFEPNSNNDGPDFKDLMLLLLIAIILFSCLFGGLYLVLKLIGG